jgi:hypothetical protein
LTLLRFSVIIGKVELNAWESRSMKFMKVFGALAVVFLAGAVVGRVTLPREAGKAVVRAELPSPAAELPAGIPDVRQSTGYSCGASALQAVLAYWGTSEREDRLMARLHTTPQNGTSPDNIVRVAREYGLKADIREGLTLEDLETALRRGMTVIADLQAWRDKSDKPWTETWDDGHYMTLLKMDANNLYFEDPSLLGARGFIPRSEFLDRWHDYEGEPPLDARDRKYVHMAMFIKGEHRAPAPPLEPVR